MNRDEILSVLEEINHVIYGKNEQIKEILIALISGGHILLEDIPGVGKTTTALAFSKTLDLNYKRIQLTPDVMPSDITGYNVYSQTKEEFIFKEGAVFCNLLLADEINRTSAKTQSALLEVMEEKTVTVETITRKIDPPFTVIATLNPIGSAGTQKLPDSQLDRFAISLSLGYPDEENEINMAKSVTKENRTSNINKILSKNQVLQVQDKCHDIFIKDNVYNYIVKLIRATRNNVYIQLGASPRATVALVKLSKANALLDGRDFVTPLDVQKQFIYCTTHRLQLSPSAEYEGLTSRDICKKILDDIALPKI